MAFLQCDAEVALGIREVGAECEGYLIALDGLVEIVIVAKFVAQVAPGFGDVGVDRDGFAKGFDGFCGAAQAHAAEGKAEVDEIFGGGGLFVDGALEKIGRFRESTGGLGDEAQEIERIDVSRLSREDAPVDRFSLAETAGAMVRHRGLEETGDFVGCGHDVVILADMYGDDA